MSMVHNLGDGVIACLVRPSLATYCAYPGCTTIGVWTIMGPALTFKGLPDVCDEHLEYGNLLGCGKQPPQPEP